MFAYYDLFYADKNYEAEADYLTQFLIARGKVNLDLGCGTGQHGKALVKLGFDVFGIDSDKELASYCSHPCVVADITKHRTERQFSSATALFHVMNYQITDTALLSQFEVTSQNLVPRGIFAIEVWYQPAVAHMGPSVRVKECGGIRRIATPHVRDDGCVEVRYTFNGAAEELHVMRPLGFDDIERFAPQFSVIHAEEFMTGRPPSQDTWSVLFVLEKR
jgi:SAM-dependent methyltransferase